MYAEYAEPTSTAEMRERYARIKRGIMKARPRAKPEKPVNDEAARTFSAPVEYNSHVTEYRKFVHELARLKLPFAQLCYALELRDERETPKANPREIIKQVSAYYGIPVPEILGERRNKGVVQARHEAMARIYVERPDLSLPQIGLIFKRDHTSVLSAVKKLGVWRSPGFQPGYRSNWNQ